jgi:hypothetical protein
MPGEKDTTMTAQLSDSLEYRGETLRLTTLPLSSYWRISGSQRDPQPEPDPETEAEELNAFADMGTWCWRRHTAHWRIELDHLYLVAIHGRYKSGARVMLEDFFPGYPERVFAHWFSGELRCPLGALLEYVHAGFASRYAETLVITVERGVVKGQRYIDNRTPGAKP